MDPVMFASAMARMPSPSIVIRNGRIVGQKGDIARPGLIWSASKSLTALIFARLLQQGKISGYDVAVPNSNVPTDPGATFRQFLSMTSDYNLSPHSPGNHYSYNNGAVHFYGDISEACFLSEQNRSADASGCICLHARISGSTWLQRLFVRMGWRLVAVNTRHGAHRVFGVYAMETGMANRFSGLIYKRLAHEPDSVRAQPQPPTQETNFTISLPQLPLYGPRTRLVFGCRKGSRQKPSRCRVRSARQFTFLAATT